MDQAVGDHSFLPPAAEAGPGSREQAARLKKLQEQEKQQKVEFRKRCLQGEAWMPEKAWGARPGAPGLGAGAVTSCVPLLSPKMEKEVSDFIQDSGQIKKKFQPMNKIERSILHDVVEVAGLTSFSFGEDDECRYVMIFKKEFAPSDEELDSYRRGEEWDPQKAEEKRKLKELAQRQEEEVAQQGPVVVSPASDYKDKYSHLIGKGAAKDAAHMLQANKTYGCVPVANKRDTRSIEEAMNEIRAKKRLRQSGEELPPTS
ncbi:sperm-associated antigen 7 isoform X2 [Canis aureus]